MKLELRVKLEVLITIATMFFLAFIPQSFESVFFETVPDCINTMHINDAHTHWTSQHYIWTCGGIILVLMQALFIIVRIVNSTENK